jgi:5-methylcytosine-specific restriction endonuclease McrA
MENKDKNKLKGAIRRAFSRSHFRKQALEKHRIEVRKKLKNGMDSKQFLVFYKCNRCGAKFKEKEIEMDHKVAIGRFSDWDSWVSRMWCETLGVGNLVPLCKPCHKIKSKEEREHGTL